MPATQLSLPLRIFAIAIALVQTTCGEEADPKAVRFFEKHIRPLLIDRCYQCHSAEFERREGGLLLDSRPGWKEGGDSGPTIIPGDVEKSLLVKAVRYVGDVQMPPDGQLSADEKRAIEQWVKLGAPDPRTEDTWDAAPDSQANRSQLFNPSDPIRGREHWAFQPLASDPPTADDTGWSRSPIDQFVATGMRLAGLRPNADADRRVLARRLSFLLTGLPPRASELGVFLADKNPNAVSHYVDQLLASPRFGELWGRHWLDLARYADSNGLDENFLFREAWRYRNWVIREINRDLPYDRFLLEQIAGDLLPHQSVAQRDRQRIASGFLVVGPKVLLGNNPQNQKMEVADEQIDTIGRAVLGQTLGCARCHDHKFDPIPTADYYALAGILTSTEVVQQRYMLGQQRVMERLVGLGVDGDKNNEEYETYWRDRPRLLEQVKHAKAALDHLKKGEDEQFNKHVQSHGDSVCETAKNGDLPKEKRLAAQQSFVAEAAERAKPIPIPPRAMIPCDVQQPADESIRVAGRFDKKGDVVPRGFLTVLSETRSPLPEGTSGRIELSRWLVDDQNGAGVLAARVLANRIWYHLFGRGIVRTVDNFGRTGEVPSDPALLDYLAGRLIRSGWSIKSLVREIVVSRSFALSSHHQDHAHSVDPDNLYHWRANRRRLEPEMLRDAMMQAAGQLDLAPRDSTVAYLGDQATDVGANKNRRRTDFPCRSVYLPVIRNDLPELFEAFDFADPHIATGMRPETTAPQQGLYMLNSAEVAAAADSIAARALSADPDASQAEITRRVFVDLIGREPKTEDVDAICGFVAQIEAKIRSDANVKPRHRAWALACHALIASSRFQILE